MQRHASFAKVFVLIGSLGWLAGCGSDPQGATGCPQENEIRGTCAGVPQAAVCDADTCTQNVACTTVTKVASDAELQMAASQATAGTCIALAPGKYGSVSLPGGVSLLGKSAADVTVGAVSLNAGADTVLRGFATPSIHVVNGATGAKIESVRVSGSADSGVFVDAQSSVTLVTSTIEGSAIYGLYAIDPLDVSLDRVVIAGSGGPGLWVESSGTCASPAPQPPVMNVTNSIVRDSQIAGMALAGIKTTIHGLDIRSTVSAAKGPLTGQFGGGLAISNCSEVDARGLHVSDSTSFGVLVDASSGTIGGTASGDEVAIERNVVGLAIQNVTGSFKVENAQLDRNEGVGIGLAGGSKGIVICRSGVTNTAVKTIPTVGPNIDDVGDGIVWTDNSDAAISDVTLSGNALASVLINGEATGSLNRITLSGGDETLGILQQNLPMGGMQPSTVDAPALQAPPAALPVPVMPTVPPPMP